MSILALYESGTTLRFHTLADYSGAPRQNLAEHSWGVALIFCELWYRRTGRQPLASAVLLALLHDAEESVTGDIPAPTKWRFPALREELNEAEKEVREELGIPNYQLTVDERLALAWADGLELYAHALRRARDGATIYREVAGNILRYMKNELPFLEEGFQLLDELGVPGVLPHEVHAG